MLFFKELKAKRLREPGFKALYDRECHICANTMAVVSQCLEMGDGLTEVLADLEIPVASFEALRDGDHCDPRIVARLCDHLGMDGQQVLKNCSRAAAGGSGTVEKGGNR